MAVQSKVAVIGAGLAGCEAALVAAQKGLSVDVFEMRPGRMTPAHATDLPAELVCSNSFKSVRLHSGHGVLKAELAILQSPLLDAAQRSAVPAGSALAVDRLAFSREVAGRFAGEPRVRLIRIEVAAPPEGYGACIVAAGPLVADSLAQWLAGRGRAACFHFYDAIAPIVSAESIDRSVVFLASRRETDGSDYLNCPFTEEEYRRFYNALREADRTLAHHFESERFFEACLPIEVLAQRGDRALAFGPLKPIGLLDPRSGKRPYAVCQLRRENEAGTCYNLVGFQTRLTIPGQKTVFSMIPGLANAEFLRFGSIHRNTYLDSPELLSADLAFRDNPSVFLAGQICGSEGYTESIATGHLAALFAWSRLVGRPLPPLPRESALGSLLHHVTGSRVRPFTPSNIHFGLFPPLPDNGKRVRGKANRELLCERALTAIREWAKNL
jgi:methylenetetrahydrofolate--tRNA-(uracil-5-)-methyltransferase